MAIIVNVNGPATVRVGTGAAGALESLGFTRDGAMVRFNGYMLDVPCDDVGGEAAPPTDIQYMGETAMLTLEFTKFDPAIADKIVSRLRGTGAGLIGTPGTLVIGTGVFTRVLILSPVGSTPFNFPFCVFREPHEINKGTKYSTWRLEATAYSGLVSSVNTLWNNSTV